MRAQLEKVTQQFQQASKDLEEKTTLLKNTQETNGQLSETVATLRQSNQQLSSQLASVGAVQDHSLFWLWVFLGGLVIAGGGFYAGMIWHRKYVSQRLGGLSF